MLACVDGLKARLVAEGAMWNGLGLGVDHGYIIKGDFRNSTTRNAEWTCRRYGEISVAERKLSRSRPRREGGGRNNIQVRKSTKAQHSNEPQYKYKRHEYRRFNSLFGSRKIHCPLHNVVKHPSANHQLDHKLHKKTVCACQHRSMAMSRASKSRAVR